MELHTSVGTGAGYTLDERGKRVPIVTLHLVKDPQMLADLESGLMEFNPEDEERWHNFALSLRAARRFAEDLNDAIEAAIAGPPEASGDR